MDESIWQSHSFKLPVKRSRPITPALEDQPTMAWNDFGDSTGGDFQYSYEDFESDMTSDWTNVPHSVDEADLGRKDPKPQMRTGCIPCL